MEAGLWKPIEENLREGDFPHPEVKLMAFLVVTYITESLSMWQRLNAYNQVQPSGRRLPPPAAEIKFDSGGSFVESGDCALVGV